MFNSLKQKPTAIAQIKGSENHPEIRGCVNFYQTKKEHLSQQKSSDCPIHLTNAKKMFSDFIFMTAIHAKKTKTPKLRFRSPVFIIISMIAHTLATQEICHRCLATKAMPSACFSQIDLL